MLKLLFTAATLTILIGSAQAQDSTTFKLNSNRIGFTESARTVTKGGLLLEAGFQYNLNRFKSNGYPDFESTGHSLSGPRLRLSYGVTKFMEVLVEANHVSYRQKVTNREDYHFDNTKYGVGLKFNLSNQKGMLPQTAISITERYYNNSQYKSYFKTTANLAWKYDLGDKLELSGNILYSYSEPFKNDIGMGIKLSYKFNEKFGIFSEWYMFDNFNNFSMINVGAWYQVTPRLLLSGNIGTNSIMPRDIKNGNSNLTVTIGATFLLNNLDKKSRKKKRKIER